MEALTSSAQAGWLAAWLAGFPGLLAEPQVVCQLSGPNVIEKLHVVHYNYVLNWLAGWLDGWHAWLPVEQIVVMGKLNKQINGAKNLHKRHEGYIGTSSDAKAAKSQHAAQRRQPKNATLCSRRALDKQPAGSFPNFTTFELRAVLVVKPTVGGPLGGRFGKGAKWEIDCALRTINFPKYPPSSLDKKLPKSDTFSITAMY